jgi:hypothetical protein
MTVLGREDAERVISRALAHLADADQAAQAAVKRDRYRQAAQLLGSASRILGGLAPEDPGPWGMPLAYGAAPPARSALGVPGPR